MFIQVILHLGCQENFPRQSQIKKYRPASFQLKEKEDYKTDKDYMDN